MWALKDFDENLDTSEEDDNEYTPPEKLSKESPEVNYLKEALKCCKNREIGIEEASLIYGVPKRTLRAKLKDSHVTVIDDKYTVIVLSAYPTEAEADLAGYLEDCVGSLIRLSQTEVRRLAYELVCEKYNLTDFPREKNCILGRRWYQKFIEKYPDVDVMSQEFNIYGVKSTHFYNNLESFIKKFKISDSHIYFMDIIELKFRASSEDVRVIHYGRTVYTNRKAICCTSPVGDFVPPVFLNVQNDQNFEKDGCEDSMKMNNLLSNTKSKKLRRKCCLKIKNIPNSADFHKVEKIIKELLNKKLQPMSEEQEEELREQLHEQFAQLEKKISRSVCTSKESFSDIFYNWLSGFLNHTKPSPKRRVLLLVPDEKYLKSFKVLELGKKNGVIFLVLPPHSIHKIYPLDGFSMSLNRHLLTSIRRWVNRNPDFEVQHIPFGVLFMEAFTEAINPLIAKNGFLYSGIWPINRNIFESSELGGECVLLMNKPKSGNKEDSSVTSKDVNRNFSLAGITSKEDIRKLCRVCLREKIYMKPLFEMFPSDVPNYHGQKFFEITKVPISFGDGLPTSVCQYCLVQLIDTIKIREMSVKSHKKQLKLREVMDRIYFEDEESENHDLLYMFLNATPKINDLKLINKVISKNFDINSICRICMGEKPLMTSIFFSRPQGGVTLCSDTSNRIMEVSQCQVHFHDGLSSSICPFCLAQINKSSEFIQRALSSEKILREIVCHFQAQKMKN